MKRSFLAAALLLGAAAAKADDCRELRKGEEKIRKAAESLLTGGGKVGVYLRAVDRFGRSDLSLMEGWKSMVAQDRVDPQSGDSVDCARVQEKIGPLIDGYKTTLEKFAAISQPCLGGLDPIKDGNCGRAVTAAFSERQKLWTGAVRDYGRAESSSNAMCRARSAGYGGFYDLQNEPTSRRYTQDKKLFQALELNKVADKLKDGWRDNLSKIKGPMKSAVASAWNPINQAETGLRAVHQNGFTPNKRFFESAIHAAVAANKLKELLGRSCAGATQCMLYRQINATGSAHSYQCVAQCPTGTFAGPPGNVPHVGASICTAGGGGENSGPGAGVGGPEFPNAE